MMHFWKAPFFLTISLGFLIGTPSVVMSLGSSVTMTVDSGEFEYDGEALFLQGDVIVSHDLGKISAQRIVIRPDQDQKNKVDELTMTDQVMISLKDGGQLNCSYARLDYQKLIGVFAGDAIQEFVSYNETFNPGNDKKLSLLLKSREMHVQIARDELSQGVRDEGMREGSALRSVVADRQVTIDYNRELIAAADRAEYHRVLAYKTSDSLEIEKVMPGEIVMTSHGQNGVCQVTHRNGDFIKARKLTIDLNKRQFVFVEPKGVLFTTSNADMQDEKVARINFSAKKLVWNESAEQLNLEDDVAVYQKGLGGLTAKGSIELTQHKINGEKQIKTIKSLGETVLIYQDVDHENHIENSHTLICYGTVVVDHEKLHTMMTSPRDDKGNVIEGKQIKFQDQMGEVYADTLNLTYEVVNGILRPKKLQLEGNVRILTRAQGASLQNEDYVQYALADRLECSPAAKELDLFASKGKRVLYIDRLNNMQVSAPALKIRRDQQTDKESIEGVGDVRFSLLEQELNQIRKVFPERVLESEEDAE